MRINFLNINNIKELLKRAAGLFFIILLIITTFTNQIKYSIIPFLNSYKLVPYLLPKDDLSLLKELAYPVYRIIDEINTYPEETNFYFVPCFEDSGNTQIWWWYLYILTRYLCYPRKIFCMDARLYSESKEEFISKYNGDAKRYSDLEWIKIRNIKYVILFRNNTVSILPIETKINL